MRRDIACLSTPPTALGLSFSLLPFSSASPPTLIFSPLFSFFTCAAGEGREGEGRQREERKQEKQTGDDTK